MNVQQLPIIQLQDGQIRGSTKIDWKGNQYYSFQGIPYGKPPVGELRFKAPLAAEPWTGIRDATKEGNECYSRDMFRRIVGSEDCLFLNVYTPELPTMQSTLKPVMVWIHGGSFTSGSGNSDTYGPDFLVAEDVVIVTINYRLGLLGFANFEDPSLEIPGNAGLKDQVLALKWVQQNITKFCGDPSNVTLFGESAGGSSVHYLILSSRTKGLFHRAIIQSGVATSSWATGQRTAPLASKALGLNGASESHIKDILTNLSTKELLELQEKIPDPVVIHKKRAFCPVVEAFDNGSALLTDQPLKLLKNGQFNHMPIMIGYNSREGMFLKFQYKTWRNNFEYMIPHELNLPPGSDVSTMIAQRLGDFYYGKETPSLENIQKYYVLQTDSVFFIGINNAVQIHTEVSQAPVYYYKMSADTKLNLFKTIAEIPEAGTAHGDELGYLFKTIVTPEIHPQSPEDIALRRTVKLWTTFAKHGDPNPVEKDPLIPITWPRAERGRLYFVDIGENLTVGVNPEPERAELWKEIYDLCSTRSKL